jgi:hypothetical protein
LCHDTATIHGTNTCAKWKETLVNCGGRGKVEGGFLNASQAP